MKRRTLALAGVLLCGAAVVLFCCGGERETGRGAASPVASGTGAEPAGTAPDATTAAPEKTPGMAPQASATPSPSGSSGSSGSSGAEPPSPGARIVEALRASQPEDLALLSQIERELSQDPPPEIHALIAQRRNGAGRAELERSIAALGDLRLKVLARRWLDRTLPKADAGAP